MMETSPPEVSGHPNTRADNEVFPPCWDEHDAALHEPKHTGAVPTSARGRTGTGVLFQ